MEPAVTEGDAIFTVAGEQTGEGSVTARTGASGMAGTTTIVLEADVHPAELVTVKP